MYKFEDYQKLVEDYAVVAYKKIKKPSIYSLDDLIQEGVIAFVSAQDKYKESSAASFKTWLTLLLRNHFTKIILKSYKSIDRVAPTEDEAEGCFLEGHRGRSINSCHIAQMSEMIPKLSGIQLQYVLFTLNPPEEAVEQMSKSLKSKRQIIRKYLSITSSEENNIRKVLENLFV